MKKFLTIFFTTLGVIFFILIASGLYVWFADPFNIRPIVSLFIGEQTIIGAGVSSRDRMSITSDSDVHPLLDAEQEEALTKLGVDVAALPSTITPEMQECFVGVLGHARVAEIQAGSTPTGQEFFAVRACL